MTVSGKVKTITFLDSGSNYQAVLLSQIGNCYAVKMAPELRHLDTLLDGVVKWTASLRLYR